MTTMHDHSFLPSSLLRRALELSVVLVAVLALQGCDTTSMTAPSGETAPFEVGFTTTVSGNSAAAASKAAPAAGDSVVISGSNGELVIQDVHLIVSGTELDSASTSGDAREDDDSDGYETAPSFLDLPLDTSAVPAFTEGEIPVGTYDELEFSVEDIEFGEADEDDDQTEQQQLQDLLTQIQNNNFPNWPRGASMRVSGTFTPTGDTTRSFATYFDAEIEVERTLTPPVEVTASGPVRTLTVSLSPDRWFTRNDGSVWNLAADDYDRTGQLVELEAEFEDGVSDIESGDDDDENGDHDDGNDDGSNDDDDNDDDGNDDDGNDGDDDDGDDD